ncbi:MAG: DUF1223 domain-containing protein [Casimicrobiaceae bacterium]
MLARLVALVVPAVALTAALAAPPQALASTPCRAASGSLTQPLVELYTSEGCDSCPPADRWFAQRFGHGIAGVPLAFHVDYWDRLGWSDRFATHANTERQYQAMRENGASFVYTPQVLVQGRDVPQWENGADAAIDSASRQPARARLSLEARSASDAYGDAGRDTGVDVHVRAEVPDPALARGAEVFVAWADSGLVSEVKAGENRGVRLVHAHVVRALWRLGAVDARGGFDGDAHFQHPTEAGRDPTLVAFVQRVANGDVLQALALPLDACAAR